MNCCGCDDDDDDDAGRAMDGDVVLGVLLFNCYESKELNLKLSRTKQYKSLMAYVD